MRDSAEVGACPVLPSVQVAPHYRTDGNFSPEDLEACIRAALEPPSAGVVLWKWEHIAADPEREAVVRRVVGELR